MIRDAAKGSGEEVFVIGGFVRDRLLGIPCQDIDFVTTGDGPSLAEKVNAALGNPESDLSIFKTFGTALIRYKDWDLEFVGARKESYSADSRKPSVTKGSLKDDQLRRDFTINALAFAINDEGDSTIIDPFHGLEDLKLKRIVTPLDPEKTFSDDPLRMMRAIRFACQLDDFFIDSTTLSAITQMHERIQIVSMERITYELN